MSEPVPSTLNEARRLAVRVRQVLEHAPEYMPASKCGDDDHDTAHCPACIAYPLAQALQCGLENIQAEFERLSESSP